MSSTDLSVFNITSDNLTLTCVTRNIQGPVALPFSQTVAIAVKVIKAFHSFLILIFGILLDSMVLFVVGKFKNLQTPSYSISLQVVVLDLMLALVQIFAFISVIAGRWPFGEVFCAIAGLLLFLVPSQGPSLC